MRPIRLAVLIASTLLAALLLVPTALAGTALAQAQTQASFGPAATVTVGDGPASVAVGDFNGDNDPDLAVANQFDGTVSVLLGTAGGAFSGPTRAGNYSDGSDLMSVAVGDFNSDGDPDLAVGDMSPGEVHVFLGGIGGSFRAPTTLT